MNRPTRADPATGALALRNVLGNAMAPQYQTAPWRYFWHTRRVAEPALAFCRFRLPRFSMLKAAIVALSLGALPVIAQAYGPNDCIQQIAQADKDIPQGLAVKLCTGAASPSVLQCYVQSFSFDNGIGRGLASDLCRQAQSLAPLSCYENVFRFDNGMGRGLAIGLCNKATSAEPLSCYRTIFSVDKGMGRGLAVDLCAESSAAGKTINCYDSASRKGMSRGMAIELCSGKRGSR